MAREMRSRHLIIGLKLLASIGLIELGIMFGLSRLPLDARLGAPTIGAIDAALMTAFASVAVYLWVVRPMKTLEEYIEVQSALADRARAMALHSEIASMLNENFSLPTTLRLCAQTLATHLEADSALIWRVDGERGSLELLAAAGTGSAALDQATRHIPLSPGMGMSPDEWQHRLNDIASAVSAAKQGVAGQSDVVSMAGHPLLVDGTPVGALGIFLNKPLAEATLAGLRTVADDIASAIKRKEAAKQVHYLAYYDSLTGLPNLNMFAESLTTHIREAERHEKKFGLVFVDLDDFKKINDTLGRQMGDDLLKAVASRLTETLRRSDTWARLGETRVEDVVRMGGDEFIILVKEMPDDQTVGRVAGRILEAIAAPFVLDDREIFVTATSGIAVFPEDGTDIETLMMNADTALSFAKREGRSEYHYYSKSMNEASLETLTLENELHRALERDELILYYQPKVDMFTWRVRGAEALVRWKHPTRGLVPPSAFIPLAEAGGLIVPIGVYSLRAACRQAHAWQARYGWDQRVSVNLSVRQFGQKDLVDTIESVLDEERIEGKYLEIEITEGALMRNPDVAISILKKLKSMAVQIAIDDFGTGYSSLSWLKRLPVDVIKIDISFVQNMLASDKDAAIVKGIIGLGHTLGMQIVAEGAETEEQVAFLKDQGCDQLQSYLSGRPMPAAEFSRACLRGSQPRRRSA